MEFLFFYAIFAITTALSAVYQILMPVLAYRQAEGNIIETKLVVYATFFLLTVVIAPIVFLSVIIPSMCNRFQSALYKGLFPKE